MITNKITICEKDILFVSRAVSKSANSVFGILCRVAVAICGIFILIEILPLLEARFVQGIPLGARDTILMFLSLLLSLFFIFGYGLLMPCINAARVSRKMAGEEECAEIEIGEDSATVRFSREGCFGENHFEYSVMEGYIEKNDAVYIRFLADKSRAYFILHNDTYIEGSKEELIGFLESKGIKRLDK